MLLILTTLLFSTAQAAPERTAGVYGAAVALKEAATHDLRIGGGLWVEQDLDRGNGSVDLYVARGADQGTGYTFQTGNIRLAAMYGWSGGSQDVEVHFGVGPALAARIGVFDAEGDRTPIVKFDPALRGRMGLIGPLNDTLAFSWHMGVTTRIGGVDYDTGLGLGVWW